MKMIEKMRLIFEMLTETSRGEKKVLQKIWANIVSVLFVESVGRC